MFKRIKKWITFKLVPEVYVMYMFKGVLSSEVKDGDEMDISDLNEVTYRAKASINKSDCYATILDTIDKIKDQGNTVKLFKSEERGFDDVLVVNNNSLEAVKYQIRTLKH